MNDRFKFRVWNNNTKEYILNPNLNWFNGYLGNDMDIRISLNSILKQIQNSECFDLEQCTGLKDKNGNLIYEGDIIYDLGEIEPICRLPLIVRWDDRTAGFYLDHQKIGMRASLGRIDSADSHNYEIIGNIHEQAEQKD